MKPGLNQSCNQLDNTFFFLLAETIKSIFFTFSVDAFFLSAALSSRFSPLLLLKRRKSPLKVKIVSVSLCRNCGMSGTPHVSESSRVFVGGAVSSDLTLVHLNPRILLFVDPCCCNKSGLSDDCEDLRLVLWLSLNIGRHEKCFIQFFSLGKIIHLFEETSALLW